MSENVAVVLTAFALAKLTVPGPLPLVQVTVTAPGGLGLPSSLTEPESAAPAGSVMVWLGPASTTGAVLVGSTVICTESVAESAPSLAVSRRRYVPAIENEAVVVSALAVPKLTVPGPLPLLQATVNIPGGLGSPSSLTVPESAADAGSVMVWLGPASTIGAWLGRGSTVICTESTPVSAPSNAESRMTYVPATVNVAVVESAFAFWKLTVPGPLPLLQVSVTVPG